MPYFHIDAEGYDTFCTNDLTELDSFDETFQIGRYVYEKSAITFNENNSHFVSLIRHNNEWVYYDGIDATKVSRLSKDIKSRYSTYRIVAFDYMLVPSSAV